ncbi:MAG: acetyl-CoA C-acyltransferase [Proteobacteria bacterium]|nr:acetyl-CoA C-acyltransferase [Pseudomonadota bacterium]MDA1059976.1 acetyl-CoA C-acyltransferase [Pseudomonadota bacterium]
MSKAQDSVVIVGLARTPIGNFQGCFSSVEGPVLGGAAIEAALARAGVAPADVDDVIMGCVLPAGMGQAPARQAALAGGIPLSVGATTINKMCGSGMRATMMAADQLVAGSASIMVAGGFESMSNAPYLLDKARGGYRLGNGKIYDHMFLDGLEDKIEQPGKLMGAFAEDTAEQYQFTREQQDAFAVTSLGRAKKANEDGSFSDEIVPVTVKSRSGETTISNDELPFTAKLEKIPQLKPAFREGGTVTAANSSAISDGAAAVVLMLESEAEKRSLTPLARIIGYTTHSQESSKFTTAPIGAINKLFEKTGWSRDTVDLFEVNEAFAVVTMAAMKDIGVDSDRMNVHGGACALGHPVGASGARIIATLYHALTKNGLDRGVASLCIGGGEATAIAIERLAA